MREKDAPRSHEENEETLLAFLKDETNREELKRLLCSGQASELELLLWQLAYGEPEEYRPPKMKAGRRR